MSETFDLATRARRALVEPGFDPDFPPQASAEIRRAEKAPSVPAMDLSHLLWPSIDSKLPSAGVIVP